MLFCMGLLILNTQIHVNVVEINNKTGRKDLKCNIGKRNQLGDGLGTSFNKENSLLV